MLVGYTIYYVFSFHFTWHLLMSNKIDHSKWIIFIENILNCSHDKFIIVIEFLIIFYSWLILGFLFRFVFAPIQTISYADWLQLQQPLQMAFAMAEFTANVARRGKRERVGWAGEKSRDTESEEERYFCSIAFYFYNRKVRQINQLECQRKWCVLFVFDRFGCAMK